jgi:hypothetical protein
MRDNAKWMLRLTLTAALAVAPGVSPSASQGALAEIRPNVEFVEVNGQHCLQPVLRTAHVHLADYREAEFRWLTSSRPGTSASQWDTELVLVPQHLAHGEADSATVQRETAHLDGVVGTDATVCFDIDLHGGQAHRHE